jgi:transcriptional regulator with XRE-family HTH domain
MDINKIVASKIKEARLEKGFTADAVARELELSSSAYSQMENAHTEITVKKLEAVSLLLEKPLSFFLPNVAPYIMQIANGESSSNIQTLNSYQSDNHVVDTLEKTVQALAELMRKLKEK